MVDHPSTARGGAKSVPNLTEMAVRALPPGETLWDSQLKGFGVRAGKARKSFVVLVASGRRQAIGHHGAMTLAEARAAARKLLAERTLGKTRPTHTAFGDAVDAFLEECEGRNRPRTIYNYRTILKRHFPFARKSIANVTPRDILKRLGAVEGRSERHHAFVAARVLFRWAYRQHLVDANPLERIDVPATGPVRERVLSGDELKALWKATGDPLRPFNAIVRLLILTGQRRTETGRLEWSWIDGDTITIPATVTKNKREHTFPIGPEARKVIASIPRLSDTYLFPAARERRKGKPCTVFNSWSQGKRELDKESGVTGWTLHQLRHTYSSGMASLGVRETVTEKLLNHVTGTLTPIGRTYNKYKYLVEMREAVLLWEAHLDKLVTPVG